MCIEDEGGQVLINRPCDNDWRAIAAQVDRLGLDHEVAGCAIEACCGAADEAMVRQMWRLSGVGPVTAWMLRAEIGWFQRFRTGKQLSRFCGLSPRNASSGQRTCDNQPGGWCNGAARDGSGVKDWSTGGQML